jgi:hypothetical protein
VRDDLGSIVQLVERPVFISERGMDQGQPVRFVMPDAGARLDMDSGRAC